MRPLDAPGAPGILYQLPCGKHLSGCRPFQNPSRTQAPCYSVSATYLRVIQLFHSSLH